MREEWSYPRTSSAREKINIRDDNKGKKFQDCRRLIQQTLAPKSSDDKEGELGGQTVLLF